MITPGKYFFVSGASEGFMPLNAFDNSLIQAGVGNLNLVKVSSILPPRCQRIDPIRLESGALTPIAYASLTSQVAEELICAAVACAVPKDSSQAGLIMEYAARDSEDNVRSIIREMLEEGMSRRNEAIDTIEMVVVSHRVVRSAAVFAGVVLCYE